MVVWSLYGIPSAYTISQALLLSRQGDAMPDLDITTAPANLSATLPCPTEREPFVRIAEVSRQFRTQRGVVQALNPVSLDLYPGEFVSVIGPSGCGKSTLMMMLAGLLPTSSGTINIAGQRVQKPVEQLGIVFQQDLLLDWRSALGNILLQAELRKLNLKDAAAEARELLAMVGLASFADAYPHELSGGMRQRVSICRALLHRPALLVMDEPFGALDALTRDQLQIDLQRLCLDRQMTVLFITHSISEAVFLSDRVVVMSPRPGRIESIVPIELPRPRRLAVRESAPFLHYIQSVTEVFESLGVLHDT
ncbi:MAG: ABC transporter ATP-binding protein [Steroidobacteraceae bacterium]